MDAHERDIATGIDLFHAVELLLDQPLTLHRWDSCYTVRDCKGRMVCRCTNNAYGEKCAKLVTLLPRLHSCLAEWVLLEQLSDTYSADAYNVKLTELIKQAQTVLQEVHDV